MAVYFRNKFIIPYLCLALVLLVLTHRVDSEPAHDKQALLSFLSSQPANRVRWNASASACTWAGVKCDATRSFVISLRLPGVGLLGPILANTIGKLTHLRVLSLRSNFLTGQIPSDFSNLKQLRSLYLNTNLFVGEFPLSLTELAHLKRLDLSRNSFTGSIPFAITELAHLKRLDLSRNSFTGSIPFAINNLKQLTGLFLENNEFTGNLPILTGVQLINFNVSNNNLEGMIPATLSSLPASSFIGNVGLCGKPLCGCGRSPPQCGA
ncbi:hypothetical protein RHGRI_006726 [Rhododendron griersonianum]|uniref:Leucine-rich repeat-containing N-terminal plant-type domain-containing protein n=1 Tax=Rhododendron griersonianum TaxID=479676 RepID=A0AAV6KUN6_9ERIC|nr:hypothetical protein RHGRI_006726 [Rhododendron griersonianum]